MAEHKSPIIWSPEVLHDIDRLWNYYARVAGRATADKIIREIAKVGYALPGQVLNYL
jgi:plasmid stabilization system protein ParE